MGSNGSFCEGIGGAFFYNYCFGARAQSKPLSEDTQALELDMVLMVQAYTTSFGDAVKIVPSKGRVFAFSSHDPQKICYIINQTKGAN